MNEFLEQNLTNLIFNSQSKKIISPFYIKPTKLKQHHLKLFSNKKSRQFLQQKSKTNFIQTPSHFSSFQTINPQQTSSLPNKQSFLPVLHQRHYNPLKIKQLYLHNQKQKRLRSINKQVSLYNKNQLSKDKQQQIKLSKQKYIKSRYQNQQILHNISFLNLKGKIKNQIERFKKKNPEYQQQKNIDPSENKSMKSLCFQTIQNIQQGSTKNSLVQLKNMCSHFTNSKKSSKALLQQAFRSKSSNKRCKADSMTYSNIQTLDQNVNQSKDHKINRIIGNNKNSALIFQSLIFETNGVKNERCQQKNREKEKMNNIMKKYLEYDSNQLILIKNKQKI